MVFYAWAEPKLIWIVFVSACLDYVLGNWIAKLPTGRMRKTLVAIGVVTNISMLVVVKYSGFAINQCQRVAPAAGRCSISLCRRSLCRSPSRSLFFEKITYLVDLSRGIARPARSFLDYLNFVFLFPKLLAGPIIKYHEIASQLRRPSHRFEDFRDEHGPIRSGSRQEGARGESTLES
jgi:alginate O-acetyltransferase complex protein AlgI